MSLYLVQILYCQPGHKHKTVKVLVFFLVSSVCLFTWFKSCTAHQVVNPRLSWSWVYFLTSSVCLFTWFKSCTAHQVINTRLSRSWVYFLIPPLVLYLLHPRMVSLTISSEDQMLFPSLSLSPSPLRGTKTTELRPTRRSFDRGSSVGQPLVGEEHLVADSLMRSSTVIGIAVGLADMSQSAIADEPGARQAFSPESVVRIRRRGERCCDE